LKAYPKVKALTMLIRQDPFEEYVQESEAWKRLSAFTATNIQTRIPCVNRRCVGGELNIESFLGAWLSTKQIKIAQNFPCAGNEGRVGYSCSNYFQIELELEFNDEK